VTMHPCAQCATCMDLHLHYSIHLQVRRRYNFTTTFTVFNFLEPIGDFMYHQFTIQEFYMVNILPLHVVYGSQNGLGWPRIGTGGGGL